MAAVARLLRLSSPRTAVVLGSSQMQQRTLEEAFDEEEEVFQPPGPTISPRLAGLYCANRSRSASRPATGVASVSTQCAHTHAHDRYLDGCYESSTCREQDGHPAQHEAT